MPTCGLSASELSVAGFARLGGAGANHVSSYFLLRECRRVPESIRSGMLLWLECRKTFSDVPVVDGRSAMLWKLAGSSLSERVIGSTRWHELQSLVAIERPDAGSPPRGSARPGSGKASKVAATTHGDINRCTIPAMEQDDPGGGAAGQTFIRPVPPPAAP